MVSGTKHRPDENTHVFPVSFASNIGFHPKFGGPLFGTILPSARPSNRSGSVPGPAEYANVHNAVAFLVGKPSKRVFSPDRQSQDTLESAPTVKLFGLGHYHRVQCL